MVNPKHLKDGILNWNRDVSCSNDNLLVFLIIYAMALDLSCVHFIAVNWGGSDSEKRILDPNCHIYVEMIEIDFDCENNLD